MGLCCLMILLRSYSRWLLVSSSQILALSYFRVLALRDDEDAPPAPDDDAITDDVIVDIVSPDILGHVMGESDAMDPPLSFDVLSGFFSCSDDVLAFSYMDLRIFEYSSLFY